LLAVHHMRLRGREHLTNFIFGMGNSSNGTVVLDTDDQIASIGVCEGDESAADVATDVLYRASCMSIGALIVCGLEFPEVTLA